MGGYRLPVDRGSAVGMARRPGRREVTFYMPRTTPIVCARAPRRLHTVPAVRYLDEWVCSWCGRKVKVVW